MFKIILPIRFTGTRYNIQFTTDHEMGCSIGYTDNEYLTTQMLKKGFKIENGDDEMALSEFNKLKARKANINAKTTAKNFNTATTVVPEIETVNDLIEVVPQEITDSIDEIFLDAIDVDLTEEEVAVVEKRKSGRKPKNVEG